MVLRGIRKSVTGGFGKPEMDEIRSAADAMEVNDDVRFRFTVNFEGKPTPLWIELFCDDENVCDPAIFAAPKLINRIDEAIEIKD